MNSVNGSVRSVQSTTKTGFSMSDFRSFSSSAETGENSPSLLSRYDRYFRANRLLEMTQKRGKAWCSFIGSSCSCGSNGSLGFAVAALPIPQNVAEPVQDVCATSASKLSHSLVIAILVSFQKCFTASQAPSSSFARLTHAPERDETAQAATQRLGFLTVSLHSQIDS